FRGANQRMSYCAIWRKSTTAGASVSHHDLGETKVPDELAEHAEVTLTDLSVAGVVPLPSRRERASVALRAAEATLRAKPDDLDARLGHATASFHLGEYPRAIDDLNAVIAKNPHLADAIRLRSLAHARRHHQDEALADLARFQEGNATESSKLS